MISYLIEKLMQDLNSAGTKQNKTETCLIYFDVGAIAVPYSNGDFSDGRFSLVLKADVSCRASQFIPGFRH